MRGLRGPLFALSSQVCPEMYRAGAERTSEDGTSPARLPCASRKTTTTSMGPWSPVFEFGYEPPFSRIDFSRPRSFRFSISMALAMSGSCAAFRSSTFVPPAGVSENR